MHRQRWINTPVVVPYQRENWQRGRPVRSLAVTWGRVTASVGRQWRRWTLKQPIYGLVRSWMINAARLTLFSFFGLLGFGNITVA